MPFTSVIVGSNRGIGLELVKQYCALGHTVLAICRQASEPLLKTNSKIIEGIDVTCPNSVQRLVQALAGTKIDLLIHNSGVLQSDSIDSINFDSMKQHFDVNALGPLRITLALLEHFKVGSKVGIVTSRVGSIEDNSSSNNYAYRTSKCAANMIGKCLSVDLKPKGIALALLHPGYVRTDMTEQRGIIDAQESARGLVKIMQR